MYRIFVPKLRQQDFVCFEPQEPSNLETTSFISKTITKKLKKFLKTKKFQEDLSRRRYFETGRDKEGIMFKFSWNSRLLKNPEEQSSSSSLLKTFFKYVITTDGYLLWYLHDTDMTESWSWKEIKGRVLGSTVLYVLQYSTVHEFGEVHSVVLYLFYLIWSRGSSQERQWTQMKVRILILTHDTNGEITQSFLALVNCYIILTIFRTNHSQHPSR